jgi:hypothetical protein
MPKLFPSGAKPGQIKAIARLIKENEGSASISALSRKIHQNIDELLPLLDACAMLGILKVSDAHVSLTEQGRKLTQANTDPFIAKKISGIEPFKSVLSILKREGELTTMELSELLKERGIAMYADAEVNAVLLKEELFKWAILFKILKRNQKRDSWSVR